MDEAAKLTRRGFLKVAAGAGGALLVGFYLPGCSRSDPPAARAQDPQGSGTVRRDTGDQPDGYAPNAWIRVDPDNSVTLMVASSEMGQGVMTSIPMLIADEMNADWSKVRAEFAPVNKVYNNPLFGRQATGGSTAIRGYWHPVREAGAAARELLVAAAAQRWGVSADSCSSADGHVLHKARGKKVSYGELTTEAAKLPAPKKVFLKDPDQFDLIGKPVARLDIPAKVDGSARFGQDVKVPGMLIATVERCPVFGGKVKSFDAGKAKAVKGVKHVVQIDSGIAVVADGFWPALQGRKALKVEWDEGPNAELSSAGIRKQFADAVGSGVKARQDGDPAHTIQSASRTLDAVYEVPYLAHACMEPMNCTADVRSDHCEIWVPTQAQTATRSTAMKITGLAADKIKVHTTFLGGGFGRRSEQDFVADAVSVSKRVGAPVKVLWTRDDDTRHDFYRPSSYNHLSAALDDSGMPVAWIHRIASPSILSRVAPGAVKNGIDSSSVEGAKNLPYAIPNLLVTYAMVNPGVPVGFWRSVGSSQNIYITECFLDEVARAGGKDPYQLRRNLLANHPRHRAVLELAAEKAGWDTPPAAGTHRGIAVSKSFASYCAQVAEVSVDNGKVRVHRVVCAIDCGTVVNPDTVRAQMESAIVYGLTAALMGDITIKNGRVQQANFDSYPVLRIEHMPKVDVYIVPSNDPPGGVGEPGTPPIAPAVANAVFAATGKPMRKLPIRVQS